MIELIHRHPIIIKVLLTVVTVTFVLTGGWLLGKEETTDYAAKVGRYKITMQQYEDSLYRMQEFYRRIYQGNMPEEVMKKLDLGKRAIEALVDKRMLLQEAEKEGISVSDREVADAVMENKSFQGDDGRFSKARYVEVLKANGMNPALFERSLREDLIVDKFKKMVKDSVYLSEDDVREAYKKQLASQNKPFKEEEFQAQKQNLWRIQTLIEQEKALASFMAGLKDSYKVVINPRLLAAS
jgi:peptidyl-prolyl cis-trans isomerase D